jgi:hypothetical protein
MPLILPLINFFVIQIMYNPFDHPHSIAIHALLVRLVLEFLPLFAFVLDHDNVLVPLVQLPQQSFPVGADTAKFYFDWQLLLTLSQTVLLHDLIDLLLGRVVVLLEEQRVSLKGFVSVDAETTRGPLTFHFYN